MDFINSPHIPGFIVGVWFTLLILYTFKGRAGWNCGSGSEYGTETVVPDEWEEFDFSPSEPIDLGPEHTRPVLSPFQELDQEVVGQEAELDATLDHSNSEAHFIWGQARLASSLAMNRYVLDLWKLQIREADPTYASVGEKLAHLDIIKSLLAALSEASKELAEKRKNEAEPETEASAPMPPPQPLLTLPPERTQGT